MTTALVVAGISIIPALILSRFWWALEEIKDLPDMVGEMVEDSKDEVQKAVQNLRSNKAKRTGLVGSAKSLFSIRSILSEADDMLGSYISVSALVNPLWLILGVFSLLSVLFMILAGIVLVLLAF